MSDNVSSREESLALVRLVVNALDDKKATDIRVFDIGAQSSVTDFAVVATGTSDPHLRALGNEIDRALDDSRVKVNCIASQEGSGWTVVDTFQVMAHIFRADQRANFQIEKLWKDAKEIPAKQFLPVAVAPASEQAVSIAGKLVAPAAKPAKKAPAKKKETAIVVRKSLVKRTAAVKSLPESVKEPKKKRTVKVAAKIAAKVKAKQKPAKGAKKAVVEETPAPKKKTAVVKPVKKAVKKIIEKKAAKVAKAARAIAKQKAKSGVVTRKARAR